MLLNSRNPSLFKIKFGREPKKWSNEDLHSLYLKAKERSDKKQKKFRDIFNTIVSEISPIERYGRQTYVVYFTQSEELHQYNIQYDSHFKCHSHSRDHVKPLTREERINFFTSGERAYELGTQFHELYKDSDKAYRAQSLVWHILWENVFEELRSRFREMNTIPPQSFTVKISDTKYTIFTEDQYGYPKFKNIGILSDDFISL